MLLSMKEHTCKLLNLPQQTGKRPGMGRPQDLTQKGAGIREGAADDVFGVLGGRDRRTRRTRRDNFQVEEGASQLLRENQSSCLLQLHVLMAFHCSHTHHMYFVSELTFSRFSVSVVTQLQSRLGSCVCSPGLSTQTGSHCYAGSYPLRNTVPHF